jgi:hypothetical protein
MQKWGRVGEVDCFQAKGSYIPAAQHSVPELHRDNAPDWWESARFQAVCVA